MHREDTNVYVGHYSEWRYLENVGPEVRERREYRGKSIEIDVQKDQGLRESREKGAERKEE